VALGGEPRQLFFEPGDGGAQLCYLGQAICGEGAGALGPSLCPLEFFSVGLFLSGELSLERTLQALELSCKASLEVRYLGVGSGDDEPVEAGHRLAQLGAQSC